MILRTSLGLFTAGLIFASAALPALASRSTVSEAGVVARKATAPPADAVTTMRGTREASHGVIVMASGPSSAEEGPAADRRFIIGLSPFLDAAAKNDAFRRIVHFLLEDMPLGSSLSIYDAYRVRSIARMEIPEVQAFASGKTRANQFKAGLLELKRFLAADQPRPTREGLDFDGAMRLPQFLDFVADQSTETEGRRVVILIGNPLYMDDKEPGFSMVHGYFPSDGHLLALRERSVFGLKDRGERLEGVVAHLGYFGDPWASELHQDRIRRFWSLFIEGQGGRLGTFVGDLPTLFASLGDGPATGVASRHYELDRSQEKIEMRRITRDVGAADWITRERDELTNLAQGPPSRTVGPMKIGIRWRGDIDLDLYARPRPDGERLYFEHMRIPEGYYFKDHRSSPERDYEFIEFETPVDVRQVEAAVNFYEGRTPAGTGGDIRIEFDGRIYENQFTIEANRGNRGREGSGQGSFWVPIDIPKTLRLR